MSASSFGGPMPDPTQQASAPQAPQGQNGNGQTVTGRFSTTAGTLGSAPTSKFAAPQPVGVAGTQIGTRLYAIARIGQARQALADMLVCYSRLLQSNDDVNSRNQLRTELAALLIDKDPDLLECVLDIAGKKRKASGPRVLELFDSLANIAKRYDAAAIPADDPAWVELLQMSERLLGTYRTRVQDIIPQLNLDTADPRIIPPWLATVNAALKCGAAHDRLPGLLAQSPSFLLDGGGVSQAMDALDELVVAGMDADAETLGAHLCSSLKTYSKEERIKAVAGLSVLIENSMDQSAKFVLQLEDALQEGCARETSETVLKPFVTYLFDRTVTLYNHGYYDRAAKHADTIGLLDRSYRKALGDDVMNPVREAGTELAKTAWAQGLAEQLIGGGDKEEVAAKILAVIDRNLATTLIACIAREENITRAQQLGRYLKQLCPGSAKTFVALMSSQNDPALLSRMLAVAPVVGGDDEILEIIYPLLTHQNFELRATALQFILDRDNDRTSAFVSSRLRDPRCAPERDLWMTILTKLRHPSAAQVVITEMQTEIDSPLQDERRIMTLIEACVAHDDPRIGVVLVRLLRAGQTGTDTRRITAVNRETSKPIRLAAMKALIPYTRDPRVYEALDRLSLDADLEISRMAAYCINPTQEMIGRNTTTNTGTTGNQESGRRRMETGIRTFEASGRPAEPGMPSTRPLETGSRPADRRPTEALGRPSAFSRSSVSGANPPLRMSPTEPIAKARKGFEELEQASQASQAQVDALFQPGQSISSSGQQRRLKQNFQTPMPNAFQTPIPGLPPRSPTGQLQVQFSGKQSPLDPSHLPDDLFTGMTPLLEGELQDLGLGMTTRITCAKNGVMIIRSSLGNGAIYIQNKIVVAAFFAGMTDIQALAAIGKLKQAQFAYYAKSFSYASSMSIEVSSIETAVREYLDMR